MTTKPASWSSHCSDEASGTRSGATLRGQMTGDGDDQGAVADAELLARHARGDRDAFIELLHRHQDRLWRVALRTLGNADDAADALQDALLAAHRSAASYRGDAAVTTWLHRIVVNACLDLVRRRSARPTAPLDDGTATDRPAADDVATWETRQEVMAALRTLPIEQAAAVVLVDVEGFPVAEVAAMLEIPVGTVKSRCARARARLADNLSHLAPHPDAPAGNAAGPAAVEPTDRTEQTEQP